MSARAFNRVTAVFLVVLLPAAMLSGETRGAIVYAKGAASVNGVGFSNYTSVFPGDRVATADSSTVMITQPGSSVVVSPNSSVRYEKGVVEVLRGTTRVSTSNGMSARVDQVTVSPKDHTAIFEVARLDKKVLVTSSEGALILSGGGRTAILEPGTAATLDLDPQPSGASGGSGFPTWAIITIVAVAAGLAIGLGVGLSSGRQAAISPSRP